VVWGAKKRSQTTLQDAFGAKSATKQGSGSRSNRRCLRRCAPSDARDVDLAATSGHPPRQRTMGNAQMSERQSLNATFFAFNKRDKMVLLPAAIAFVVALIIGLIVIGVAAFYAVGGMSFIDWYRDAIATSAKGGAPQPPPNMGAVFLILPFELVTAFVYFVLLASFESSCLRWMIRGEKSGPLNLCFGADMWRVYATYWVWFLYFFCTGIGFFIWMIALGAIGNAVGGQNNPMAVFLVGMVGCIAWVVAWVYAAVRLAPASATSIGAGHFAPTKAWSVSSDRFWGLFGAFLLIFIIYVVAAFLNSSVTMGAYFASLFSGLDWTAMKADPKAFSAAYQAASLQAMAKMFSNPLSIALYCGGQFVLYALALVFYIMFYGVNARAVQVALEDGKLAHEPPAP